MPILVVTTAATVTRLAQLSTLKAELGITTGDLDESLALQLDQASNAIESYLGRRLATETVTETFRGWTDLPGGEELMLGRYPIQSVTSVTVDGVLLDPAYYLIDQGKGALYRIDADDALTPWDAASKIAVVYTAGYTLPGEASRTLPAAIERACLDVAKAGYFSTQRDPALKEMEVPGVLRESYWVGATGSEVAGIPGSVASGLEPFRSVVI